MIVVGETEENNGLRFFNFIGDGISNFRIADLFGIGLYAICQSDVVCLRRSVPNACINNAVWMNDVEGAANVDGLAFTNSSREVQVNSERERGGKYRGIREIRPVFIE